MSIRNIVFDLGNVIVDLDYSAGFDAFGVDTGKFESIYHTEFFHSFERGHVSEEEFFDFFCSHSTFRREDIDDLKKVMHRCFPLRPRVWDLLQTLKDRYRVFLLSNTNILDFGSLEGHYQDIREPFEKVYLSYEQGRRKPDDEVYAHAESVFGIRAEETLFLDDRPENTEAASRRGWQTVQVKSEAHIFESLAAFDLIRGDRASEH